MRRPLLNFTSCNGPLSTGAPVGSIKLDKRKMKYSPRFVNVAECMPVKESGARLG